MRREVQQALSTSEHARTTFAVRPGHAKPDVEDVVASYPAYDVVRKKEGLPARLAEETAR